MHALHVVDVHLLLGRQWQTPGFLRQDCDGSPLLWKADGQVQIHVLPTDRLQRTPQSQKVCREVFFFFRIRCHLFCFSPCWTQFLKDILRLPAAVGERQTFNMNNDSGTEAIFDPEAKVWRITTAAWNLVQHLEI